MPPSCKCYEGWCIFHSWDNRNAENTKGCSGFAFYQRGCGWRWWPSYKKVSVLPFEKVAVITLLVSIRYFFISTSCHKAKLLQHVLQLIARISECTLHGHGKCLSQIALHRAWEWTVDHCRRMHNMEADVERKGISCSFVSVDCCCTQTMSHRLERSSHTTLCHCSC